MNSLFAALSSPFISQARTYFIPSYIRLTFYVCLCFVSFSWHPCVQPYLKLERRKRNLRGLMCGDITTVEGTLVGASVKFRGEVGGE